MRSILLLKENVQSSLFSGKIIQKSFFILVIVFSMVYTHLIYIPFRARANWCFCLGCSDWGLWNIIKNTLRTNSGRNMFDLIQNVISLHLVIFIEVWYTNCTRFKHTAQWIRAYQCNCVISSWVKIRSSLAPSRGPPVLLHSQKLPSANGNKYYYFYPRNQFLLYS